MNIRDLTLQCVDVMRASMQNWGFGMASLTKPLMAGAQLIVVGLTGGCINIAAPEEPIVIELNINISQQVLLGLVEDANEAIDENEDIF